MSAMLLSRKSVRSRVAFLALSALASGFTAAVPLAVAASAASNPPSAHCHATDGRWTTCPDGSAEWSDVTPQEFPATHSFLYADEADLDPALRSSDSNPADTFTLIYDECDRKAPLGPDEYLNVSFDTVEQRPGTPNALVRYTVHIFADATLIFFENGQPIRDAQGRLRVSQIEGQRASAGFGTSPRCGFDHVFAEYEIRLTATGIQLHGGYSPDPAFWGADPPPKECPVPDLPEVTDPLAQQLEAPETFSTQQVDGQRPGRKQVRVRRAREGAALVG